MIENNFSQIKDDFDKLKQFRQSQHMLLGQAKDAVCDLIDAV